jgi:dihydrofolate reductase
MSGGKKINTYGLVTYVFTRSLPAGERDSIRFTSDPPRKIVDSLRQRRGKDIWLMGGGELARDFLKDDLVDELYLGVVPTLIGEGIPLFPPGFPQREFKLLENKTYSRGLISLKYARTRTKSKRSH